jgi:ankyrin repeat protein
VFLLDKYLLFSSNQDNKLDTMNSMIKCGADVNTKSSIGITPLMDAVSNRDHVIVQCLLQASADPNIKDIFGLQFNPCSKNNSTKG